MFKNRRLGVSFSLRIARMALAGAIVCIALAGCEGRAELQAIHERLGNSAEGRNLPEGEDYYGADVADRDHAWVVGSYGSILYITDSASKVALQKGGTHYSLFCVSANGPSDALIGGERGLMLRTTDAGQTWTPVTLPKGSDQNISAMSRGNDPNQIWVVGPVGMVIHSADDGKTWEDLGLKKDLTLNAVTFIDDKQGWITGEFGTILHTTDGAHTWQEQTKVSGLPKYVEDVTDEEARHRGIPTLEEADLYLFKSGFTSPMEGDIVGAGGFVLHTVDGGQNWQALKGGTKNTLFSYANPGGKNPAASGILGTLVREKSGEWKLDNDVSGNVFTWLRSIVFAPDASLGIIAGGKGTILLSRDKGVSWSALDRALLVHAGGH